MPIFIAALCGLIFGAGLVISGMVNPAVVLGFLDILGDWNPALLFVMGGALAVTLPGYWFLTERKPAFAKPANLPSTGNIDRRLILGAMIFGAGWGLAGICPGPGITMLGIEPKSALIFLGAMTAGIMTHLIVLRFNRDYVLDPPNAKKSS